VERFRDELPALVSVVVGFGAVVPLMITGVLVGTVTTALDVADLSFYIGFPGGRDRYLALRKLERPMHRSKATSYG